MSLPASSKSKLKMHNVLLGLIFLLFLLGVGLTIYKSLNRSAHDFKSTYQEKDVLLKLTESSAERMFDHKLEFINELLPQEIAPVYVMIFKKEKQLVVWSENLGRSAEFTIQSINPGDGFKLKMSDDIFPEGIFDIEDIGLHDQVGHFIELHYPSELHLQDQRIKAKEFEKDVILISEKPQFFSYATLSEEDLEDVIYFILKVGKSNVKVLVFPSRPPLEMGLSGSRSLVETLKKLNEKYQLYIKSKS